MKQINEIGRLRRPDFKDKEINEIPFLDSLLEWVRNPRGEPGKEILFFGNSFRNKCGCANRKSGVVTEGETPPVYFLL